MGITTCNIEEPQQKYRLGTVSGKDDFKHVLQDPNPRPLLLQWFETFGPNDGLQWWETFGLHEGSLSFNNFMSLSYV